MAQPSSQINLDPSGPYYGYFWYAQSTGMYDARSGAMATKVGTGAVVTESGVRIATSDVDTHYPVTSFRISGDFTIGFRIRRDASAESGHILGQGGSAYGVRFNYAGFSINLEGEVNSAPGLVTPSLATYYIVRTGLDIYMYKDGELVAGGGTNFGGLTVDVLNKDFVGGAEFYHIIDGVALDATAIASLTADPYQVLVSAVATAVTLSPPSPASGDMGAASGNFTVSVNGALAAPVVVTPSDGGGGGTFTPTSVTLTPAAPTAAFTYTPASGGAKSISVTNGSDLANPSAVTYTAAALSLFTSGVLTRNNNVPASGVSLIWLTLVNASSGTFVLTKTGVTTNGSGVFSVADSALVAGVAYQATWLESTGQRGCGWATAT